jgi:type VI secretion system protein ImpK
MNQTFDTIIKGKTLNIDFRQANTFDESLDALCTDLFLIIMNITPTIDMGSEEDTRTLLKSYIDLFDRNCTAVRIDAKKKEYVKYALIALIDEKMLKLPEKWSKPWCLHALQLDYYSDMIAGEKFFDYLNLMMKNPENYYDVLEIYYLCICLGFKGKHVDKIVELRSLMGTLPRMIIRSRPTTEPPPVSYHRDDGPQRHRIVPHVSNWFLTSIAAVLVIGTWIGIRVATGNISHKLLPDPQEIDKIILSEQEMPDCKAMAKKAATGIKRLKGEVRSLKR